MGDARIEKKRINENSLVVCFRRKMPHLLHCIVGYFYVANGTRSCNPVIGRPSISFVAINKGRCCIPRRRRALNWTSGDGRSVRVEVLETRAVAAQTELDFGQQIATVFDQPSQEAVAVDAVAFGGGRCTPSKKKQKKTKQNRTTHRKRAAGWNRWSSIAAARGTCC